MGNENKIGSALSTFFKKLWDAILIGLKKSGKTLVKLLIYIVPTYFIVQVLKATGVLDYIAGWFSPVMKIFGLPGEAALALILGGALNIYSALGIVSTIGLSLKQLTIVGLMIGCAHTLPVETSVTKTLGLPYWAALLIRIGSACLLGLLCNWIWVG